MCFWHKNTAKNDFFSHFLPYFYVKNTLFWFAFMNLLMFLLPNLKSVFLQYFTKKIKKHKKHQKNMKNMFLLIRVHEFTHYFTPKLVKTRFSIKTMFFWFAFMNLLIILLPNIKNILLQVFTSFCNFLQLFMIRAHEFTHYFTPKLF